MWSIVTFAEMTRGRLENGISGDYATEKLAAQRRLSDIAE